MKKEYKYSYGGYFSIHRNLYFLVNSDYLNFTEFNYFILFAQQVHWYKKNKEIYGYLLPDDVIIASQINTHPTTIFKQRKKLISKSIFIEIDGNTYFPYISLFNSSILNKLHIIEDAEFLQEIFIIPHKNIASIQQFDEYLQKKLEEYADRKANFESKVFNSSSKNDLKFQHKNINNEDVDPNDIPF